MENSGKICTLMLPLNLAGLERKRVRVPLTHRISFDDTRRRGTTCEGFCDGYMTMTHKPKHKSKRVNYGTGSLTI